MPPQVLHQWQQEIAVAAAVLAYSQFPSLSTVKDYGLGLILVQQSRCAVRSRLTNPVLCRQSNLGSRERK